MVKHTLGAWWSGSRLVNFIERFATTLAGYWHGTLLARHLRRPWPVSQGDVLSVTREVSQGDGDFDSSPSEMNGAPGSFSMSHGDGASDLFSEGANRQDISFNSGVEQVGTQSSGFFAALARFIKDSFFLGRLPEVLARDLTWLLSRGRSSFIYRLFLGVIFHADSLSSRGVPTAAQDTSLGSTNDILFTPSEEGHRLRQTVHPAPREGKMGQTARPPVLRLVGYCVAALLLLAVMLFLPRGTGLVKRVVFALILALVWARPAGAVYAIVFLLPLLPLLSSSVLIAIAFLARLAQGERLLDRHNRLQVLSALFVFVGLAAALLSQETATALRYWRYYFFGLLLFLMLQEHYRSNRAKDPLEGLVQAGLLGAAVVSLLALWQYLGGMPTNLSWVDIRVSAVTTRVVGSFDNPNMLAGYLTVWLPFAVAAFLDATRSKVSRLYHFFLTGLLGLALLLTFSRGGWVAFAAALFAVVLLQQPRLLWLVPLLVLLAPLLLPQVILQRLLSIINLADTSNMVRLYVWESGAKMFFANWFLGIGQGLASFARVYPVFQYGVVPALHAHSLLLQLAVEGGVFSLLLFLWLGSALWRLAVARWQLTPSLSIPLGAAFIGHLVHGIFDHAWYDLRLMLLFWLLLGLAAATGRRQEEVLSSCA